MRTPLTSLFGPGPVTAEGPVEDMDGQLFPEELAYIRRAVPVRRAEFGTARVYARRALAELGVAPVPLVPQSDRAPSWPRGYVGSISHTRDRCAVVVAREDIVRSIGLDIESARPLERDLEPTILTPRELAFLRAQPSGRRDALLMLFFSAKEAYYKCQYPLTKTFLDHLDVEIDIREAEGRFEARAVPQGLPQMVRNLAGRFVWSGRLVMCGVELSRPLA